MKQYAAQGQDFRALIVCPLSIMQRVWGDAIFNHFLGNRTFAILHGDADKRSRELAQKVDFYIINFDGVGVGSHTRGKIELDGFSKQLAQRNDIQLAIIDEASAYKDATTNRHKIARQVFGQKKYLWLMTGTPTPNSPTDAYGLAKLVNNANGKSFRSFQDETMARPNPFSPYVWKPRPDGYDKARRLLQPAIRVDIKDVWDGPELTTQQREVPLTTEQKQHMAALKRDFVVMLESGEQITAVHEAAARMKFLQISAGAIYDASHKAHVINAKPRLDEVKAVIEESPSKVLLFANLVSIVALLYRELHKKWACAVVNGDVSQNERSKIFHAFQSEAEPRILIADPGTMAHGLDLYAAQTVVWYSAIDKTELYLQAIKRAHRPGQKYPVTVVQIVSNQLEREIFRRAEYNESMQGALLDAVRKNLI
jgi:SNF2 family DNA or RNA helicase